MTDLIAAAQNFIESQDRDRDRIKQLEHELEAMTHDRDRLDGQLQAMTETYKLARADSDHYLSWATEVTRQLYNINHMTEQAIQQARKEIGDKQFEPETETHNTPTGLRSVGGTQ